MRFYVRNLNQRAEVKEVAYGYDTNYKEIVKTIFLRSLFVFLWSLLLIIPGIYKAYQYRMIPYLMSEYPGMTKDIAFAESKRMMDGQKWKAFVLDLSFLGWGILSALTLGILGVFYVMPYQQQTNAALYEKLRYGLTAPTPTPAPAPAPYVPAEYAAPAYSVSATMPTEPMVPMAQTTAAMPTAPIETAPVFVPESQPPVPPFAAVKPDTTDAADATDAVDAMDAADATDAPDATDATDAADADSPEA